MFYSQKSIEIDFLYQSVNLIQELDSKKRKIRSFRGFFLYALEIIENGKYYEVLETNLQPFFWTRVKNAIQQNNKSALEEFLFGKLVETTSVGEGSNPVLDSNIQELKLDILELKLTLKSQFNSLEQQVVKLQERIFYLETKLSFPENSKSALRGNFQVPEWPKPIEKGDFKSER